MFRHLDFLLKDLHLDLGDFDLFAVAAGPGSFTGLRVGLAAVKGWAEVYVKPVAAVSGLAAVAAQSTSRSPIVVPVLDAHRGQVYFGIYRRTAEHGENPLALDGEECVMTPDEFIETLNARGEGPGCVIVTPVPALISVAASRNETSRGQARPVPVEQVSAVLAPHVGRLGYMQAQRGEVVDALTLDANYVRRTDAELHWKAPKQS
jgi:tRNA threonylcarbamoyladenosine biosynthesis protein TsaB